MAVTFDILSCFIKDLHGFLHPLSVTQTVEVTGYQVRIVRMTGNIIALQLSHCIQSCISCWRTSVVEKTGIFGHKTWSLLP